MDKHSSTAKGTCPSKTTIMNWVRNLFPELPLHLRIEDFGNGVLYCRILNHYFPASIPSNKILHNPKNQYQFSTNLRHLQQALVHLNLKVNFDVNKVSKRKFLENWALINALYKELNAEQTPVENQPNSARGKKTVEFPFPEQNQFGSGQKPPLQPHSLNFNYMVPVWERNSFNMCLNNNLGHQALKMNNYFKESPVKGKWSVNSQMFKNNQSAVVDRVKEILLKSAGDTEKIKQIKILLGIPIEEEDVIKIEQDDIISYVAYNQHIKSGVKLENEGEKETERIKIGSKVKKQFKL